MTTDGDARTADRGDLDQLLQSNGIQLGAAQRRRLDWMVERFGAAMVPERDVVRAGRGVVIVIEPPSGAGAELVSRSLHAGCAVVIPFGENPAFDFLKSKFVDFGTVGPCGPDFPHEMWWGGGDWPALDSRRVEPPRVISCYPRSFGSGHARRLEQMLTQLQISFDIEPIETSLDDRMLGFEKAEFILNMWQRHRAPLLFIEADAALRKPPLLPAHIGCDFAVHKWNRWEMSPHTLYFGRSEPTEMLLRNWQHLARSYPAVSDGYLLDQAWSLTSAQTPLDTVWLPRTYHALIGDTGTRRDAVIAHNLSGAIIDLGPDPDFADMVRSARRAGRTGAREALIVLTSPAPARATQGITVILRDFAASSARAVAASVEAVTRAFATDPGAFSQFELSLCPWQDDIRTATKAAEMARHRVLEISPTQPLPGDLFRNLASSAGNRVVSMTGNATERGG